MQINLPARPDFGKRSVWPALAALAAGIAGCGGQTVGYEKYVPTSEPARVAVVAVLDAWRDGRPPDVGVGPRGDVHVVDKQRKPGQRLKSYELLGEVAADNARAFAVRLGLETPDERPVVRFVVVGLDPLWVFRQEDFELISHWMHPMEPLPTPVPDPSPAASEPRP